MDLKQIAKELNQYISDCCNKTEDLKLAFGYVRLSDSNSDSSALSIVYETPGGSTNQIGLMNLNGRYVIIEKDSNYEMASEAEAVGHFKATINSIPKARKEKLDELVKEWTGKSKDASYAQHKIQGLQTCHPVGGRVTSEEIGYAIKRFMMQRK